MLHVRCVPVRVYACMYVCWSRSATPNMHVCMYICIRARDERTNASKQSVV